MDVDNLKRLEKRARAEARLIKIKESKEKKLLKDLLKKWVIVNPSCLIIEQDEVADNYQELIAGKQNISYDKKGNAIKIEMPDFVRKHEQTAIGTGIILKKESSGNPDSDYRLKCVEVGDRIKFSAGSQIPAEFKGFQRVQILHIANVLMASKD